MPMNEPNSSQLDQWRWVAPPSGVVKQNNALLIWRALTMLLVLSSTALMIGLCFFVGVSQSMLPALVETDSEELQAAEESLGQRTLTSAQLESEIGQLSDVMERYKAQAAIREQEFLRMRAERKDDLKLTESPNRFKHELSSADRLYLKIFANPFAFDARELAECTNVEKKVQIEFVNLILRGARCGHANLAIATTLLGQIDCPDVQKQFIEVVIQHPAPLARDVYCSISDQQIASNLLRFSLLLPSPRKGAVVSQVLFLFPDASAEYLRPLNSVEDILTAEDWSAMSDLLAHPSQEVRKFCMPHITKKDTIDSIESAINGKDFVRYIGAVAWFQDQTMNPEVRDLSSSMLLSKDQLLSVEQSQLLIRKLRTRTQSKGSDDGRKK